MSKNNRHDDSTTHKNIMSNYFQIEHIKNTIFLFKRHVNNKF
jgi:hypothetical protein